MPAAKEPRYKSLLKDMLTVVEAEPPGTRLPTVQQWMKQYRVGQASVDRCLDELVRLGLVRRRRGSGLYTTGIQTDANVIAVYAAREGNPQAYRSFLNGVRNVVDPHGLLVADFGLNDLTEHPDTFQAAIAKQQFAGIIREQSTAKLLDIEAEQRMTDMLHAAGIPVVTRCMLPNNFTDWVSTNYYAVFYDIAQRLRDEVEAPFLCLGQRGLTSMARLQGFVDGLADAVSYETELLDGGSQGITYRRLKEVLANREWSGNIVLCAPHWDATRLQDLLPYAEELAKRTWVLTLDADQTLPAPFRAHVIRQPNRELGREAGRLLLRRLRGYRGERLCTVVPSSIELASSPIATNGQD